jgi:ubiquinone/menaquinone biosynthesis C-methylase UbiE
VIEALTFPDHSFDVVFSSLMMHHLPAEVKQRGLAEIARVLKPGGTLVIVDMKQASGHREQLIKTFLLHGSMGNGVQQLTPLLEQAGFVQIETGDTVLRMVGYVRAQTPA